MQTYNSYYEQELTKIIDAEIVRLTENLFAGTLGTSEEFIRDTISTVNALKTVRDELMPMADKKCQEK